MKTKKISKILKDKSVIIVDWPDRSWKWTLLECLKNKFEKKKKSMFYKNNLWEDFIQFKKKEYIATNDTIEVISFLEYQFLYKLSEKYKIFVDRWILTSICYNELRLNTDKRYWKKEAIFKQSKKYRSQEKKYSELYWDLLLVDSSFNKKEFLNIVIIPNIEEWKERCSTKREDEYDDIAKDNYEILCESYDYVTKNFIETDSLILDFNNNERKMNIYFQRETERKLIDSYNLDDYNIQNQWIEILFKDFIKKYF